MSQRLDLISSNKHVDLQNLSIYCTRKNIRKQYNNNKPKIRAPTLNAIPTIHVHINRINHRLSFKTKDGYKLELVTPERMKLFSDTKKLRDKTKNEENVPSVEVVETV